MSISNGVHSEMQTLNRKWARIYLLWMDGVRDAVSCGTYICTNSIESHILQQQQQRIEKNCNPAMNVYGFGECNIQLTIPIRSIVDLYSNV